MNENAALVEDIEIASRDTTEAGLDTAAAAMSNTPSPADPSTRSADATTTRAATPAPRPPRATPNRHRSNIARLPHAVREMLNQGLREGMSYYEIIRRVECLTDIGHGVTPANLSVWYRTGYREWLRQKTHLEDTIAQNDAALTRLCRLSKETGASLPEVLDAFLASLAQRILRDFDPAALHALLAEKPGEIFRLIACLNDHIAACSRHKTAEVARVRCQVEVAEKAESARKEPVSAKNLCEAELVSRTIPTPFDYLRHEMLKHRAEEEKAKKRRRASKTAKTDPEKSESV